MTEPFDKNAVLYRFAPSEEDKQNSWWEHIGEYVVLSDYGGALRAMYYLNEGIGVLSGWREERNIHHFPIIAHLLTDLAALKAENVALRKLIDGTHADVVEILGEVLRVPVDGHVAETIAQEAAEKMTALKAERDACRDALQMLADGCSSPGYPTTVTHVPQHHHLMAARAALAQGQKLRERESDEN